MKKVLFTSLFLVLGLFNLSAQENSTLLKGKYFGLYAGPTLEVHHIDGVGKTSAGIEIGAGFGNMLFGGYLKGVVEEFNSALLSSDLGMIHGGMSMGYVFMPESKVHMTSKLKIGIGQSNVSDPNYFNPNNSGPQILDFDEEQDDILAVTPELAIEMNLLKNVQLAFTGSYQYIRDLDSSPVFNERSFSGFGGGISLRIGLFGKNETDKIDL